MNTYTIHHKGLLIENIPFDSLTVQLQKQGLSVNLPHELKIEENTINKVIQWCDEQIEFFDDPFPYRQMKFFLQSLQPTDFKVSENLDTIANANSFNAEKYFDK